MSYLDNIGLTHFFENLKNIFVPKTIKINNKTLDSDVTLSPADIGAASSSDVTSVTNRVTTLENNANKHLDLTKTSTQTMSGALFIGGPKSTVGNAFTHQRKPTTGYIPGKNVYGAAFAVDMTGRSTFQSKSYNDSGASGVNDAVLRFSKDGIQFAKNSTTTNMPDETDYKELATQEWVTNKLTELEGSSGVLFDDKDNITYDDVVSCYNNGIPVIVKEQITNFVYYLVGITSNSYYWFVRIDENGALRGLRCSKDYSGQTVWAVRSLSKFLTLDDLTNDKTATRANIGIITLTQSEYDELSSPDEDTIYIIVG